MIGELSGPQGETSNGAGNIFVGLNNGPNGGSGPDRIRRGLLEFDVPGVVPAGATINSATLTIDYTLGPPPSTTPAIAAADANKAEGDSGSTPFAFTVARSGDTTGPSAVNYSVAGSGQAVPHGQSGFPELCKLVQISRNPSCNNMRYFRNAGEGP